MPTFLDPTKHKTPFGTYPEISVDTGWPEPHLIARPRDEIGESIIAFANLYRDHPNLQESPWDPRTGTINLVPPDEPRPATDPIPRYRLRSTGFVGCNLFLAGQTASFPGYPIDPFNLEAVNPSAALVLTFMEKYGAGQKLAGQPYQSGRLNFPNPALRGSPISPTLRWAGAAA
jgi:hypothetical protein